MSTEHESGATRARLVPAVGVVLLIVAVLASTKRLEGILASDGQVEAIEVRNILVALRGFTFAAGAFLVLFAIRGPLGRMLRVIPVLGALIAVLVAAREVALWTGWIEPPVKDLPELCAWLTEGDDPYLGLGLLDELRSNVAEMEGEPPSPATIEARYKLADCLLRHGHVEEAIEVLDEALAQVDTGDFPPRRVHQVRVALGLAWLRRGEVNHCVRGHNKNSCVFPLVGDGVWPDAEASGNAVRYFTEALLEDPGDNEVRWLLNLAHMTQGTYPDGLDDGSLIPLSLFKSDVEVPRFTDIGAETGTDAFNLVGGAVLDDFDDDGYIDILTSTYHPCEPMIYLHNDGDGGYSDWSERSGLDEQRGGFNQYPDRRRQRRATRPLCRARSLDEEVRPPAQLAPAPGRRRALHRHRVRGRARGRRLSQPGRGVGRFRQRWLGRRLCRDGRRFSGRWPRPSQLFRNRGDLTFEDVAEEAGVENRTRRQGAQLGGLRQRR